MILDFFLSYPLKKNASFKGSFQGKTCYIFGNGSSLKNMCFSHFRDHPTIGINHIVLHKDFNLLNTCCYAFPEPFSFYYYYKNPYKKKYEIKIISALTISNKEDVDKYKDYLKISDIILFDSKGYHKSESFDHNLLEQVPNEVNKMIAGNIQIEDIPNFKNKDFIIDLSGSIENNEGKKDIYKIDKLLKLFAKT